MNFTDHEVHKLLCVLLGCFDVTVDTSSSEGSDSAVSSSDSEEDVASRSNSNNSSSDSEDSSNSNPFSAKSESMKSTLCMHIITIVCSPHRQAYKN